MDEHAKSPEIFDCDEVSTAIYSGKFSKFNGAAPTEAQGTLTMHGVTKPVTLVINSFMCKPNPMTKKEVCGADAIGILRPRRLSESPLATSMASRWA